MSSTQISGAKDSRATTGRKARSVLAPTAVPGAVHVSTVFAVALFAIGAIALRDFMIAMKWITGSPWLTPASRWIADLSWQGWMWPAAVALCLVGLWLLIIALRPRSKTHVAVTTSGPVEAYAPSTWTRRSDIARRASAVSRRVPGVESATTVVSRRKISTQARVIDVEPDTVDQIRAAIAAAVAPVFTPKKIVVKITVDKAAQAHVPPPPVARPQPVASAAEFADDAPADPDATTPGELSLSKGTQS
ncbi:DUF6286 domain-containing protein [Williamsia sp. CHRR-6]|uniref:DUF6286 domain-containing protein n=1 Tax=Williamsia sp. CHRR-6 TaxID=2835871 RepID=UPI001BDADBC6|nr:DUF6286 domain-containing protein [Williamsia sp. CHRR-6]MBT0567301.1 hypothetical protein [Williamsia sp. CHRR-6]